MPDVYINDISVSLPGPPIHNDEMEAVLGQIGNAPSRSRRIVLRSNGIKSRHYVIDKTTRTITANNAQLTAQAIRGLAQGDINLDTIGILACGTSSPDLLNPNHALMTQGELGMHPCEAIATSGICLSGVTALKTAFLSIKSGEHTQGIATGSEVASLALKAENYTQESPSEDLMKRPELAFGKDFIRWMLSDGAGAMLLSDQPNPEKPSLRIAWIDILSYAGEMEGCMYWGGIKQADGSLKGWREFPLKHACSSQNMFAVEQDVKLLNEHIVEYTVTKPLKTLISKRKIEVDDIDFFLPHYSSMFFRDKMAEGLVRAGLPIPMEKSFTNLTTKGNTGAASIYIILEELFNTQPLHRDQKILCFIPESGRFSTAFMMLEVV